ncbi:hypothetical protein GCM10010260_21510 [Streptomyces filipinensis]|uniref:Uncharacterized protein n=1 Tax=Streptomyces filipinensis TaxID=66887 RepID=A0A918I8C6_9ACTN|nr:hypothetical protein GCM10010260_21510 [Streptomyces filipinensis]
MTWRAAGGPPYGTGVLRHLPPPAELPRVEDELADRRAGYRYGTLYHATDPEAVAVLVAERLVPAAAGWAAALPPRVRRWPVPCTAI